MKRFVRKLLRKAAYKLYDLSKPTHYPYSIENYDNLDDVLIMLNNMRKESDKNKDKIIKGGMYPLKGHLNITPKLDPNKNPIKEKEDKKEDG